MALPRRVNGDLEHYEQSCGQGGEVLFKVPWKDVARPIRPVNLLVGLNEAGLHPTGGDTNVGKLRLLYSEFGTGKLLDGAHPSIKPSSPI